MSSHRKSMGGAGPTRLRPKQRRRICRELRERYGDKCFYCTRPFSPARKKLQTLDHLTPLSRGGTHETSNLVLCCSKCNNNKGDRTWWEYVLTNEYWKRRIQGIKEPTPKPSRPPIETIRSLLVTETVPEAVTEVWR